MRHTLGRRETQVILIVALVLEIAAIAYLVLSPTADVPSAVVIGAGDWLRAHNVPGAVADDEVVEFVLNAGMFIPMGATLLLLIPRVPWWAWFLVGFVAAGSVEATQGIFLDGRSASWIDALANSLGLGLGAAFAGVVQRTVKMARDRKHARLALL